MGFDVVSAYNEKKKKENTDPSSVSHFDVSTEYSKRVTPTKIDIKSSSSAGKTSTQKKKYTYSSSKEYDSAINYFESQLDKQKSLAKNTELFQIEKSNSETVKKLTQKINELKTEKEEFLKSGEKNYAESSYSDYEKAIQALERQLNKKAASSAINGLNKENANEVKALNDKLSNLKSEQSSFMSEQSDYDTYVKKGASIKKSDNTHRFINDNEYKAGVELSTLSGGGAGTYDIYNYMTDEEKNNYNYLYGKNGKKDAEQYLSNLESTLQERKADSSIKNAQTIAQEHPAAAWSVVRGVNSTLAPTLSFAENIYNTKTGKGINENSDLNIIARESNAISSQQESDIYDKYGKVGVLIYGVGSSMADMAAGMAVGKGAGLSKKGISNLVGGLMGSNAATSAIMNAKDRDIDDSNAVKTGIAAFINEAVMEKLGLDAIFKVSNARTINNLFKGILISMGAEGTEEVLTSVANTFADRFINKDKSELNLAAQKYIENGATEKEAKKQAFKDYAEQISMDFLGGAIAGGLFSGAFGTASYIGSSNKNKYASPQTAVDNILSLDENTRKDGLNEPSTYKGNNVKLSAITDNGIELNNGETVKTDDPDLQLSETDSRLLSQTKFFNKETANAMIDSYDGGNVSNYSEAFKHAYNLGYNYGEKKGVEAANNSFAKKYLDNAQLKLAVQRGSNDRSSFIDEDSINKISKAISRKIVVYDGKNSPENGYFSPKDNTIYVNSAAKNNKNVVIAHELTHSLESTNKYEDLKSYILGSRTYEKMLNGYSITHEEHLENYKLMYKEINQSLTAEEVEKEIVADFVSDTLFKDEKSITDLALKNKTLFMKIREFLYSLRVKIAGTPLEKDVLNIEKLYAKALEESNKNTVKSTIKNDNDIAYSIKYDKENTPFVIIEEDILKGLPKENWVKAVKNNLSKKFPEGVKVANSDIKINAKTKRELTFSKHSQYLKNKSNIDKNDNRYSDKLKSTNNVDEILKASRNYIEEAPAHERKDTFISFARGTVLIRVGNNDYSAHVIVGTTKNNDMVLYDIVDIEKTKIAEKTKKVEANNTGELQNVNAHRNIASTNTTIAQDNEGVNSSISTDSENDTKLSYGNDNFEKKMKYLIDKYGAIKPGVNPVRDVQVPKKTSDNKNVRQTLRTILESDTITDDMVPNIQEQVIKEALSYEPISDIKAQRYVVELVSNGGIIEAKKIWNEVVSGSKAAGKKEIAIGEYLLKQAAKEENVAEVVKLVAEIAEEGTRAGQVVQAISMLKKLNGAGQLYYVQKTVDKLNKDIRLKDKTANPVKINEKLAEKLIKAETKTEIDNAINDLMEDIADQVPVTWFDKWNAWRYFAMLGNPRTHVRNLVGNAVFYPAVKFKDVIGVGLEKAFVKEGERTKAIMVDEEYKDFAINDFEGIKEIITGTGKYNPSDTVRDKQQIFKTKWLEGLRKGNFNLLEKEDVIFLRKHYERALSGYLQANKIDISNLKEGDAILSRAREYAVKEAQKATYRDAAALASVLQHFSHSNRFAGILVEGVIPFKKTPINILKRGVEYSPAGLVWTVGKGVNSLRTGEFSTTEFIDGLSAGFTGTAIMAIGMALCSMGVITGGLGDDKEKYFEILKGNQEYSLKIGDKTYTIDWMAPASLPLFVGVELMNIIQSLQNGEQVSFADVSDTIIKIVDPMFNLSMLDGINKTLEAISYSDSKAIAAANEIVTNYFMQAVPTLSGQLARTIDETQRRTYIDKNSNLPSTAQTFIQKVIKKVPGLSFVGTPMIDQWGREKKSENNVFVRAFENFLSPGYLSTITGDEVDEELSRLYKQSANTEILPGNAQKYITVDGVKKDLTAKEYTEYSKVRGTVAYSLVKEMFASDSYNNLSDTEKEETIKDVYLFANASAKTGVSDYELDGWYAKAESAYEKNGLPISEYIVSRVLISGLEADKDEDGKVISGSKKEKIMEQIDKMDISDEQKDALLLSRGYSEESLDDAPWRSWY